MAINDTLLKLKIDDPSAQMAASLARVSSRDLPFVVSSALNNVAFKAMPEIKKQIEAHIDRPTSFVLNSLKIVKASKQNLSALIEWRNFAGKSFSAGRQLEPQVHGGGRKAKGFERLLRSYNYLGSGDFVVPADGVASDPFGNVPSGTYTKVLSFLKADPSGTQTIANDISQFANAKGNRAAVNRYRERKRRAAAKYFVVSKGQIIGTGQPTRLPNGIYERTTTNGGKRNSTFRALFFFVSSVRYSKRLPLDEFISTFVFNSLPKAIDEAIEFAAKARASFKD
jgi:hypothetical protein